MEVKLLSGALGAEIKGIDLKDTSDQNFKKTSKIGVFLTFPHHIDVLKRWP